MNEYKTCTKCGQIKDSSDFYDSKRNKSGKESICIVCKKIRCQANYQANKDQVNARTRLWQKNNPDKKKEHQRIWRKENPEARKNWSASNREKTRTYAKAYRINNPEASRNSSHNRRAKLKNTIRFKITAKELKRLYASDCFYCGKQATHLDHVIPLSRGGSHGIGNLVAACEFCNLSKNNKFITEWKKGE
jgi:5-methylcytosine-specific restriction endonuclease McrA